MIKYELDRIEIYGFTHDNFEYRDGKFFRIKARGNMAKGDEAGYLHTETGRWMIRVCGKLVLRSRLVYLYHHGVWPEPTCDHKNADRLDDRIENLRPANRNTQALNRSNAKTNGLPRGIVYRPQCVHNPYRVKISHMGQYVEYSHHPTLEAASARADSVYKELGVA